MTRNETKVWMNYHLSIFPDFRTWWQSQTKESRALIFEGYCKALQQFSLTDGKEASDAILAGHAKKPWDHQDTLSSVVKAARDARRESIPKPVEGQQTFSCAKCLDSGWLDHAYTGKERVNGSEISKHFADGKHFYATVCACHHGDKHRGKPWCSSNASPI